METFEMNIKDLTYNQLQKLKIKPMLKGKEFYDFEDNDSKPHGRPFASLRTVLESVDANCGFNVEIKYPQRQIVIIFNFCNFPIKLTYLKMLN